MPRSVEREKETYMSFRHAACLKPRHWAEHEVPLLKNILQKSAKEKHYWGWKIP